MGLLDYVRSSYDLGEQFTNVQLQTRDLGETMNDFWIDPKGYLWRPYYEGTTTLEEIQESDVRYNKNCQFFNFVWIPTGNHGKCRVHPITQYINVYPSMWEGPNENWPKMRLHFRAGKLLDYEKIESI
jgi:hypothetical protein